MRNCAPIERLGPNTLGPYLRGFGRVAAVILLFSVSGLISDFIAS